jgi:hypothetical protein
MRFEFHWRIGRIFPFSFSLSRTGTTVLPFGIAT